MSMATNGSESKETIIDKERLQMAKVHRDLEKVFKIYEKRAKARLGELTRGAHQAYEVQETDQSECKTADIQKLMEEKVEEMKRLKEDVERCLENVLKEETSESEASTSKADKRSESQEWKKMDVDLEKMLEDAAAKGDKGEDFDKLPETFRNCLLCLSIFPLGSDISKRVLIYWWIGEGFVSPIQQKSAEQVGEDHFKKLLDFEFIHPVYNKRSGSIVKCRIHPWIHWMLISKAKESNFFNFDETGTPTSSPSKGHRACLITKSDDVKELKPWPDVEEPKPSPDVEEPKPSPDVKEPKPSPDVKESKPYEELVFLFNINVKYLNLDMEYFSRMKKIVVLQLGRWHASAEHHIEMDPQLLEKLCSLINLRYLSLRGISVIETIPKSIGKLQHLQVLDLRGCQNLKNLTDGITKLRRLTHLDVSECYMLESMPKGLSSLSKLLVLKGFVISERKKSGRLADLINLVELKKLSIIIGSQVKTNTNQFGELQKMESLSSLTVIWSDVPENTPGYKPHLVDSLKFPPNLEKLDLRFYPIIDMPKWLDPKYPTQLEKLKKLYIRGGKLGALFLKPSQEGIHPKLELLRLKFLQKLKLKWSEIELPSLDYFEHFECQIMEDPPLMDVDRVWTKVKGTDSDVAPGATTTDATTSQTHRDTTTTATTATSTPTATTSTSTSDSTISAPSAIAPDAATSATTATSPSPSSSPTLASTTTDAATSQTRHDTTTTATIATSTPTTTTSTSTSDSTISAPSAIAPDAATSAITATSPPSPSPSSSPTLATTTTDAATSQTRHDTTTTAPIATSTSTATTSTSTSDSTISAPLAIAPDAATSATTATSPPSPGPSSSPTLATTTTTTTNPLATPNTGPALTPPTYPTTTTSVSPPTPKVVPSTPNLDDDNEHDEPAHDPSSSASTEAHLIDPHTTSLDGISASGVDSLVDEPTSGTPHVPSHILPAPTTASGPSSSTPTIVPPNKVDHEDDLEDKSEHDITSTASTVAHAIDPNTASSDDVVVSAFGAASMAAEPTSGTPSVPSHSVPGPTNAADVTRDSSLSSNPSSSTTTSNQPSISTPP